MKQTRNLMFFTGSGFLFLWLDLSLGHLGAGLKHPAMWVPLLFLPCAVAVSYLSAMRPAQIPASIFRITCGGIILVGLAGFAFHLARFLANLKGIIQWQVLIRLTRYPPLFAPLAVTGLGILGLLASAEAGPKKEKDA